MALEWTSWEMGEDTDCDAMAAAERERERETLERERVKREKREEDRVNEREREKIKGVVRRHNFSHSSHTLLFSLLFWASYSYFTTINVTSALLF